MQQSGSSKPVRYLYGPVATVFAATQTGTWRIHRPVINQAACNRCGKCARFCPLDIITMDRKDRSRDVTVDLTYCKGCGICAAVCPLGCIAMVPEGGEG
ncbi:MAG: 4Fe-4S binding protein [Firmicutes bacterium]|nr:4Fe-4S binding protein [Bacillota bacterium]